MAEHAQPRSRAKHARKRTPWRAITIAMLALVVSLAGVGGAIAWLNASGQVSNRFEVGEVNPTVNEEGGDGGEFTNGSSTVKRNVNVSNDGNVPIYVRAQISIYWVDANGNQLWEEPKPEPDEIPTGIIDGDYRLTMGSSGSSASWVEGQDGFYYWTAPLEVGNATADLIEKLERINAFLHKDGRQLVCDIAVQGIQADPADAVKEAWGVTIADDGTLTLPAASGGAGTGSDTAATTDTTAEEA